MSTIPYIPTYLRYPNPFEYPYPLSNGVKPEWFGAQGDGSNDDSEAFRLAIIDGRSIELEPRKTYCVKDLDVPALGSCPGWFSRGGRATVKMASGATETTNILTCSRSEFFVDGVFFDLPASTDPSTPPLASAAIRFGGTSATRWRITNCRFRGGNAPLFLGSGTISDTYIAGNEFEGAWSDSMDIAVGGNVYITDNIIKDAGYSNTTISGAIRVGYANNGVTSENCIIARNIIRNCCLPLFQSAIDCYGPAFRNIVVVDNVSDLNGNGIELKTDNSMFDDNVYQNIIVSRNLVRLLPYTGTTIIGIALGLATTVPDSKPANAMVEANVIFADAMDVADGLYGITGADYDNVTIRGNKIFNVGRGINLSAQLTTSSTLANWTIADNDILVSNLGIYTVVAGTAIDDLVVAGNTISAGGRALQLRNIPVNRAKITGNVFVATGATAAMDLGDMHDSLVQGNTIVGGTSSAGVTVQGTASTNLTFARNDVTTNASTGLDAFVISTGTVALIENTVTVPDSKRGVSGAGTYSNRTNRGFVSASPTASKAAALGDYWMNSDPGGTAVERWVCTSAGAAGANTLKTAALA